MTNDEDTWDDIDDDDDGDNDTFENLFIFSSSN